MIIIAILIVAVLFVLLAFLTISIYLYVIYQKEKQTRLQGEQKLQRQANELKVVSAQLESAKTYSSITSIEIEKILKSITNPNISDISIDSDGDINFKFKDKDRDLMPILVKGAGSEQLIAIMFLPVPDDYLFSSIIATNSWNQRTETQSVFAYTINYNDKNIVILESDLVLRGGVGRENIKSWLETYISKINSFETNIISDMQSLDLKDSQLKKNSFWGNLGEFVGVVLGEVGKTVLGEIINPTVSLPNDSN
ncbi:MAG: hypothetical protein HYZ25_05350 [Chloroflexi bacterium]|nr:hypothetical protein [Chloroflexota bacterium]